MKRFLTKILILFFIVWILSILSALILSIIVKNRNFNNSNTESNLLHLKKDQHYDVLIMGISHARNLARDGNHFRIEKILNKDIVNIGQGDAACGVNEQLFYLNYFYHKGNRADTVLYILSTPLLYADYLNKASNTFIKEPFTFDFLIQYIKFRSRNKIQRIQNYIFSKLDTRWIKMKPSLSRRNDHQLLILDSNEVSKGFDLAYLDGIDSSIFRKNCQVIDATISFVQSRKSTIILILPPALFGKWKGHAEVLNFCQEMSKKYGIQYYDFSECILEPKYYYDHHHLNTEGIELYGQKFLKPILR